MANKKMIAALAALLMVAMAVAPATAMDCKAGCAELQNSPLGLGIAECEKKCAEIAASEGPRDPYKESKQGIP